MCDNKKLLGGWNWHLVQLSAHIACNLGRQLWERHCEAYLLGQGISIRGILTIACPAVKNDLRKLVKDILFGIYKLITFW